MLYKRKESPNWYYEFEINGRRFRGSTKTPVKKEAREIEEEARRQAKGGGLVTATSGGMTLAEAIVRYFDERLQHKTSAARVLSVLKHVERIVGGGTLIQNIGNDIVAKYVAKRVTEKCANRRVTLISNETVNYELGILKAMLRYAKDAWDQELPRMPSFTRHRLPEKDTRRRYLTDDEADRLLSELPEHLAPVMEFSLLTGVRRSNALKLAWEQVNWRELTITFQVKSRKLGGKTHVVPITKPVLDLLKRIGPKAKGRVFLFRGRPFDCFGAYTWRDAMARAGVTDFRWHDIRHTTASWLVAKGVPIEAVQRILGHENIATTMRYVAQHEDRIREALGRLEIPHKTPPTPGVAV